MFTVALKKMALDQVCFAPVFFSVLMPILWLSQGVKLEIVPEKLKQASYNIVVSYRDLV